MLRSLRDPSGRPALRTRAIAALTLLGLLVLSAPLVLVHHRGRKSGRDYVNPTMYLPDERDDTTIYIFASKGGASSHPDWYYNLTAAAEGTIERGQETYRFAVREVTGNERESQEAVEVEGAALDDKCTRLIEKGIILGFVAKHRPVAFVEFDFDAGRQFGG